MVVSAERDSAGRQRLLGVLMGLGYGSGWAVCTVWLGRLMDTYPLNPTGVMFWRGLIVSVILLGMLVVRGRRAGDAWRGVRVQRRHLPFLVLFGFIGITLNNASWGLSVSMNGVTVATVMAYSAPIFTVLLSRPLFGEPITHRKALSLVMALVGCLFVSQVYDLGDSVLTGTGIAVAAAVGLFQAGRDLMGKKAGRMYPETTNLFYAFAFGTVFLGLAQLSPDLVPRMPLQGWLELAGMSLGIMLSYLMYLGALSRLPVSVASILGLSEPVVAALLAYLVLGETLVGLQVVGALLVIGGVLVLEVRDA